MDVGTTPIYHFGMTWSRSTFFMPTSTSDSRLILQSTRFAELFIQCLLRHYARSRASPLNAGRGRHTRKNRSICERNVFISLEKGTRLRQRGLGERVPR